jgi:Arm domain-containing DNA-binding protein
MGLGPVDDFTLDEARERARRARQLLRDGIDPLDARKDERASQAAERALAAAANSPRSKTLSEGEGSFELAMPPTPRVGISQGTLGRTSFPDGQLNLRCARTLDRGHSAAWEAHLAASAKNAVKENADAVARIGREDAFHQSQRAARDLNFHPAPQAGREIDQAVTVLAGLERIDDLRRDDRGNAGPEHNRSDRGRAANIAPILALGQRDEKIRREERVPNSVAWSPALDGNGAGAIESEAGKFEKVERDRGFIFVDTRNDPLDWRRGHGAEAAREGAAGP